MSNVSKAIDTTLCEEGRWVCRVLFPPGPAYWTSSGCVSATARLQGNGKRPGWITSRGVSLLGKLETGHVPVAHRPIWPIGEAVYHLHRATIDVGGSCYGRSERRAAPFDRVVGATAAQTDEP
jgi:hypothetical protein